MTRHLLSLGMILTLGHVATLPCRGAEAPCVVCGASTAGEHAVVHGGQAYWIHTYPCQAVWDRALSQGLLDGQEGPIAPGSALFEPVLESSPAVNPAVGTGGRAWFWALFLVVVASLSGGLGLLFAILTHRSPLGGFLLGFFLPAVGMVLVPVLKEIEPSSNAETEPGSDA